MTVKILLDDVHFGKLNKAKYMCIPEMHFIPGINIIPLHKLWTEFEYKAPYIMYTPISVLVHFAACHSVHSFKMHHHPHSIHLAFVQSILSIKKICHEKNSHCSFWLLCKQKYIFFPIIKCFS